MLPLLQAAWITMGLRGPVSETSILEAALLGAMPAAASLLNNRLWYAVPLIAAISLVYGATRHELMRPILIQAWRSAKWIVGFLALIFAVLFLVSWSL